MIMILIKIEIEDEREFLRRRRRPGQQPERCPRRGSAVGTVHRTLQDRGCRQRRDGGELRPAFESGEPA